MDSAYSPWQSGDKLFAFGNVPPDRVVVFRLRLKPSAVPATPMPPVSSDR
jgi:hypothetical protein